MSPRSNAANPFRLDLAEIISTIGVHQHLCSVYESEEQQYAVGLPFLKAGLDHGEKCLYLADENSVDTILRHMRAFGLNIDQTIESDSFEILGKQDSYVRNGKFDPDAMISYLAVRTDQATAAGYSGFRFLGEMMWAALEANLGHERLLEYESKLNFFVATKPAIVICQYNRLLFPPEIIQGVIRTHPLVVYEGEVNKNPYYVPPEDFLKPGHPQRELDRLLDNIRAWNRAEQRLQRSYQQLRALTARLQTVREQERTRVAREIHDELGQALTAIKIDLTFLLRNLPLNEMKAAKAESILALVDNTIGAVRRISTELRPGILDDLGLVAALDWAAEEFTTRTGIQVHKKLPEEITVDEERATALFRIFQETLTNIARHSGANEVSVELADEKGVISLQVHDNGKGISEEQFSARDSLGILGMRERAFLLGGELTIMATPGEGTTVRVQLPHGPEAAGATAP